MRWIFLPVLCFALSASGWAIDEPSILAAGEWSDPVNGSSQPGLPSGSLRARLLLCESPKDQSPAVYLELQECSKSVVHDFEVYYNFRGTVTRVPAPGTGEKERTVQAAITWAMLDSSGQPAPTPPWASSGASPTDGWITVPCDTTVRLRASLFASGRLKNGNWNINVGAHHWEIPARGTQDYFLSCTLTVDPPKEPPIAPERRIWRGTLILPKMKLPVQRP